MRQSTYCCASP